jgi:hypothetical protein
MNVVVATRLGHGRRDYDVCDTVEGELVVLLPEQSHCWICRRVMIGLTSGLETTTFTVVDRPQIDRRMYREFVRDALDRMRDVCDFSDERGKALLDDLIDFMLELAESFPPGAVLERFDREFSVRYPPGSPFGFAA